MDFYRDRTNAADKGTQKSGRGGQNDISCAGEAGKRALDRIAWEPSRTTISACVGSSMHRNQDKTISLVSEDKAHRFFGVMDGISGGRKVHTHPELGYNGSRYLFEQITGGLGQLDEIGEENLTAMLMRISDEMVALKGKGEMNASTGTFGWVHENRLVLFHKGDSRAHFISNSPGCFSSELVTHDDVDREGGIYSAFGSKWRAISKVKKELSQNSMVLICTDGFGEVIEDFGRIKEAGEDIASVLRIWTKRLTETKRLHDDASFVLYNHGQAEHIEDNFFARDRFGEEESSLRAAFARFLSKNRQE